MIKMMINIDITWKILLSGKRLHNYGKSSFLMGKSTISMVIFNSYVKLPEGINFKKYIMT